MYIVTYTYIYIYIRVYTPALAHRTGSNSHAFVRGSARARRGSETGAQLAPISYTYTHTHTPTRAPTPTHTHTRTHIYIYIYIIIYIYMYTYIYICNIHTYTYTYTYTYTDAIHHTQTETRPPRAARHVLHQVCRVAKKTWGIPRIPSEGAV